MASNSSIKAGSQYDARKGVVARSVVMQIGASSCEASLRIHPVHNVSRAKRPYAFIRFTMFVATRDIQLKSDL